MAVNTTEATGVVIDQVLNRAPVAPGAIELNRKLVENIKASDKPLESIASEKLPDRNTSHQLVTENVSDPLRQTELNDKVDFLYNLVETGNPNFIAHPQERIFIESIISQNSVIDAQYQALAPADRDNFLNNLLKEPKTIKKIEGLITARLSAEKRITFTANIIQQEVTRLTTERTRLETEKTNAQTAINNAKSELQQFETSIDNSTTPPTIRKGAYLENKNNLTTQAEPLKQQKINIQKEIALKEEHIKALISSGAPKTEIDAIQAEIATKNTELQTTINSLSPLEQQIKDIDDRKKLLENTIIENTNKLNSDSEINDINAKIAEKEKEFRKKNNEERNLVDIFTGSIDRITQEAIAESLNEKINKVTQASESLEAERTKNSKDDLERIVRANMMGLLKNPGTNEINWNNFRGDFNLIMRNGWDNYIQNNLGLTPDQFNSLRQNQELYKNIKQDLIVKMAGLRVRMPRVSSIFGINPDRFGSLRGFEPISQQEGTNIITSLGKDFLQKLALENKEIKNAMSELQKEGMTDNASQFGEWVKKLDLKAILMIIAAILGITIVGVKGSGS